ncbi:MAG: hypothetical protein OXJ52_00735 [Oligoflexia bacterium]|nr:hypothetical protein [Oligoflexia bacterium]
MFGFSVMLVIPAQAGIQLKPEFSNRIIIVKQSAVSLCKMYIPILFEFFRLFVIPAKAGI